MLFLIENFLKPKVPDSVFEIPVYVMYRKDRPGVKQGGGILSYVNFKLKENRRIDLEEKEIETLWLDIFTFNSKRPILVGALYRPPSSNVDIDSRIEKMILRTLICRIVRQLLSVILILTTWIIPTIVIGWPKL